MPVSEVGQRENHFYLPRILGRSFVYWEETKKGRHLDCEVARVIPTRLWRQRPRPCSSARASVKPLPCRWYSRRRAQGKGRGSGRGMTGREQINGDEEEERAGERGKRGRAVPAHMPSEIQGKEGATTCEYSTTARE